MENIVIRNEAKANYRAVETLIRKAFWNVYAPGCDEHYLAHVMRRHPDFIPELAFVAEANGQLAASILYVKSKLADENGGEKDVLTFGPIAVLPEYQRRGIGKRIIRHSLQKGLEMGYDAAVIFGNPENYICSGFKSCKKYGVTIDGEHYPTALLVRELKEGALAGKKWVYHESPAYQIDGRDAEAFDRDFEPMVKAYRLSQELFYIYSRSNVVRD